MNENPSFIEKLVHSFEVGIILAAAWIYGVFHPNDKSGPGDWEN